MLETIPKTISKDWVNQYKSGRVVPIIGSSLDHAHLSVGPFENLVQRWAESEDIGYPWPEQATLTLVAEYLLMKGNSDTNARTEYLSFLKTEMLARAQKECMEYQAKVAANQADPKKGISEIQLDKARQKNDNDVNNLKAYSLTDLTYDLGFLEADRITNHSFRRLAALSFNVYITTSFHRFLEIALFQAGKQPVSEVYHWDPRVQFSDKSIFDKQDGFKPTEARPLVYHLFGRDDMPESLVISESDYLNWLTNHSPQTEVGTQLNYLPPIIRIKLSSSAPLLLGYDLGEWDFKVLFHGLILKNRQEAYKEGEGIILQQLRQGARDENRVKVCLENYLHDASKLRIFWGPVEDCIEKLYRATP